MTLKVLSLEQFNEISANAHKLCFYEDRSPEMNTFDFALLVTTEKDEPFSYATILEVDKKSAYMQHGGAFPPFRGSPKVLVSYRMVLDYLKNRYEEISTRICNKNIRMLKLALNEDLLVDGIDISKGEIFLNLSWSKVQ